MNNKKNYFKKIAFFAILISTYINSNPNLPCQLDIEKNNNNTIIRIFIFSLFSIFLVKSIFSQYNKNKKHKLYSKKIKKIIQNNQTKIQNLINSNKGIIHSYKYTINECKSTSRYLYNYEDDIHIDSYSIRKNLNKDEINIIHKFFKLVESVIEIINKDNSFQDIKNELFLKKINLYNIVSDILLNDLFMQTLLF